MNCLAPVADIQAKTAAFCQVPLRVIKNYERSESAVTARQVAAYLAHELTGQGPYKLSHRFNRDHSTIRYSIAKVRERCEADPEFAADIEALRERLAA